MSNDNGPPVTDLQVASSLDSPDYDAIILVATPDQKITSPILHKEIASALDLDPALKTLIAVLPVPLPAKKLVYSPTGPIDPDYDDVRIVKRAAFEGTKRALKAGSKRPLLVIDKTNFEDGGLVTLLGALEALYTPIQVREHDRSKEHKVDFLGVWTEDPTATAKLIQLAQILESGRRVACDIGDADPERMTPLKAEEYITKLFADTDIKLTVVSDDKQLAKDYPLFQAVNRAASCQERHRGRIIFLEYSPAESAKKTLFLVGKGVTYDTGGADVKISSNMVGMSRDKCGAAAAVGFMQTVSQLKPKDIRVVAAVGLVRNSIGSNSYVADEVITARSGTRVRIVNTDAEGRMVMADILCKCKEEAVNATNPHLFTIATLTGHACLTVGEGYSIVIDNGPAKKTDFAKWLQESGEVIGDPFEISTLKREDLDDYKGVMEGDDVIQSQTKPSTQSARGHQGPAAFLLIASGLNKYGSGSTNPIKYSHLDIAASAGRLPSPATGAPVLALAKAYLL